MQFYKRFKGWSANEGCCCRRAGPHSSMVIAETLDRESPGRAGPNDSSRAAAVKVNAEAVRTGRALLRIFEHGEGPGIEIAWPGTIAQRECLHDILRRCFGMKLALIDRASRQ